MNALILWAVLATSQTWEVQNLQLINEERAAANAREFAIYGEILQVRQPLQYDTRLEDSAQWWCDALKGSGHFDHFGWLNAKGHLIDASGRQISRVWLPTYQPDRLHFWVFRNQYLGIEAHSTLNSSENGTLLRRASPSNVVGAFVRSGWAVDPRAASHHYRNVVDPRWTHMGVAKQTWGGGKTSVFCEFVSLPEE